ncbi:MAG TPA: acetyl-CoA carboxylase biotin carboxylase subunit, partial [Gemmatimonadaceae bacterium]|nr:acetyl-CoA carboxylase biotin carboxylase subunit [Gemmatimonadaceae bacterium]
DPMLGKLIVWGADRAQAVARMRRALVDLTILGIETSRDFHVRVMDDAEFQQGAIDIQWLERRLASILERPATDDSLRVAAIAAALLSERDRSERRTSRPEATPASVSPGRGLDTWTQVARRESVGD